MVGSSMAAGFTRLDVRYRVTLGIAAIHIHIVVMDECWMIDRCYRLLRFHATQVPSIPTAVTGHHITPQVFSPDILGPDARLTFSSIYPGEVVTHHSHHFFEFGCQFPLIKVICSVALMDSGVTSMQVPLKNFYRPHGLVDSATAPGDASRISEIQALALVPQICAHFNYVRVLYPVHLHVFSEVYREPWMLDSRMPGAPGIYEWRTSSAYIFWSTCSANSLPLDIGSRPGH
jgi:hypothetical protein